MKILFSPSEAKTKFANFDKLSLDSFLFPKLFNKRVEVINKLNSFLQTKPNKEIELFFGLKNPLECEKLSQLDILTLPTCRALKRYSGVAYQHLNFATLKKSEKEWLFHNTIIFSNLFGPILGGDRVPYYRFKQGSKLDGFKPEVFYKEHFTKAMDRYLVDDLVIDLRAGFYEKFYTMSKNYISMKFIKNGKIISHWAKAYRGKILRELAIKQPQNIKEFEAINFDNLHIEEIIERKFKKEYVFSWHESS